MAFLFSEFFVAIVTLVGWYGMGVNEQGMWRLIAVFYSFLLCDDKTFVVRFLFPISFAWFAAPRLLYISAFPCLSV